MDQVILYWTVGTFRLYNIFVTSYSPYPFAIVQNQWTNNHDHDLSYNIDIYTYKNGKWIIDNQNSLYKNLRKIIDEAKMRGTVLRFSRLNYFNDYISIDVFDESCNHLFNVWESLDEYVPEPEPEKIPIK